MYVDQDFFFAMVSFLVDIHMRKSFEKKSFIKASVDRDSVQKKKPHTPQNTNEYVVVTRARAAPPSCSECILK